MLSRRLLLKRQLTRLTSVITHTKYSSQLARDLDMTGATDVRLSQPKPKQPTREPFAKNIFVGKFDVEFLTYPEPQTKDRHCDFFEWLKPIEKYVNESLDMREYDISGNIPREVFDELQKLGVLRAAIEECYGGLGLNNSEYAKLVETVSVVPVLGTFLVKRASVIKLISEFGTDEQKSNVLPKIATDELRPALCFSEDPTGMIAEPLIGTAVFSECRTFYLLNARKSCVIDAKNANLFVVLTRNTPMDKFVTDETFAAFLVPHENSGITIDKPIPMMGQHGLDHCAVSFKDIKIPVENQMGNCSMQNELFLSTIGNGKHNVGGQAIGILKQFLNLLTTNIRQAKNFNRKKHMNDTLQETIGKLASSLYAMEAMTYLTTGMMDNFETQDCLLEQSLVECYCTATCVENILYGMHVLGMSGYDRGEPFEQIVRDALALAMYDRSGIDTKIFAALLGMQHAGLYLAQAVTERRNPMFHPIKMLRNALYIKSEPKLYLDENLHPSLRISAISLEVSVNNFKNCVADMFIRYGIRVMGQRMELNRLVNMLIEIYAMTAVVARASRSYCIGLRNAEHEVKVAMIFTYNTSEKVNSIARTLKDGDWANGDVFTKDIADSIFQKKSYFAEHPLERNF